MSTIVNVKLTASQFDAVRAVVKRDHGIASRIDSAGMTAEERHALAKRIFELDTLDKVFS